ncbi:MAG: 16S rRNA (uracil(1498)-N(3))-methyltransferase [Halieaceae bacterium]|jgi:16S rRNA (uracil1498-N3)-methyltransferase|nr:16S rRNA (uracil(1498)-N(3))-methyltransferase [Halieaceae bacterium]
MLRPRFFTGEVLDVGASLRLEAEPSRHIARALRMRAGDRLCLFGGDGREATAEIVAIERNTVEVRVLELREIDRESPLRITLAIGLSRGDRMDTVVQKATELGAAAIWPLTSAHTGVRLDGPRLQRKLEHWRRIALSACEQCGRNALPAIESVREFGAVLDAVRAVGDARKLMLHPENASEPAVDDASTSELILLVGPEGGFSADEVARAIEAGFQGLRLGPRILRTETAPLAAIAVAQARWGDFRHF